MFPSYPLCSMLHPTVRLLAWGAAAALVQRLPLIGSSAACSAALFAAAWLAPARLVLLLKRTRWLIVSLVLIFALATPGVYLEPKLGSLGPTEEGLWLGIEHLLRLLFVLASLAMLLQLTGVDGLVAGLYGMILPLAWLGLDRARVAVRLMLVMRYAEHPVRVRHWREWLTDAVDEQAIGAIRLRQARLALADYAVLAGLTFGVFACLEFSS